VIAHDRRGHGRSSQTALKKITVPTLVMMTRSCPMPILDLKRQVGEGRDSEDLQGLSAWYAHH